MSGLKMFECLGDCADFDLVNGCVAEGRREDNNAASRQAQQQGQQQGREEEYSGSEDASDRSYSDVRERNKSTRQGGGAGEGGDGLEGSVFCALVFRLCQLVPVFIDDRDEIRVGFSTGREGGGREVRPTERSSRFPEHQNNQEIKTTKQAA